MLDVVEDEEQRPCRQEVSQAIGQRLPALLAQTQRAGDRGGNQT
jgi:hypothetical protein